MVSSQKSWYFHLIISSFSKIGTEQIINESEYTGWSLGKSLNPKQIGIEAKRIENIPGTHSVSYDSTIDSIEIKHIAKNRERFGLGAVIAAEWFFGKTGVFSMEDVLNIK